MNIKNVIIRNATQNDIYQIVKIKINGWKETYVDIIDNNYLNNISLNDQISKYTSSYSLENIFVAELNNEIVGFCRVYDYEEAQYDGEIDCEIREIYVRSDIKRMGIGSKLFIHVLKYFKDKNKSKLYLGVFEENYKSRNFYEKMGGIFFKKDFLEIGGKQYPTVSYIYELRK